MLKKDEIVDQKKDKNIFDKLDREFQKQSIQMRQKFINKTLIGKEKSINILSGPKLMKSAGQICNTGFFQSDLQHISNF